MSSQKRILYDKIVNSEIECPSVDINELIYVIDHNEIHEFIEVMKIRHSYLPLIANCLSKLSTYKLPCLYIHKMFNFIFDNGIFESELITLELYDNKNLVIYAIENGNYTRLILNYVYMLQQQIKVCSSIRLDDELAFKIANAFVNIELETHPRTIMRDLIIPLYDNESVTNILNNIGKIMQCMSGQEWLDSYYN